MNCCIECFADSQIREIINSSGETGNCDFCGRTNVKVHPTGENGRIEELLESILDIYRVSLCPADDKLLRDALLDDWNIFSVSADVVQRLITAICPNQFAKNEKLFSDPVCIPECQDDDYLTEFGITSGYSWSQFSKTIKYQNRFS